MLTVVGRNVVIENVEDPIDLALSAEKFASMNPDQVEEISLEEQRVRPKSSS